MYDLERKIKQLEKENLLLKSRLSAGEKKYRIFFNKASDPMTILDGNIFIAVNQAVLDVLGYDSKDEFLSEEPSVFSPAYQSDGRKSSEKQDEMITIALEKGTYTFEWEHKKKNGDILPLEISLTTIDVQGKEIIHAIWRDLTEKKQNEVALEISEKNYKQIVEGNPFAILVHKNGKVVYCNKSMVKLSGAKRFIDLIGLNVLDFVHPDDKKIVIDRMKESSALGVVLPKIEEKLVKLNGDPFFAEVSSIPIEFETEAATMVIINDISDRRIAEEKIINETNKYHNLVDNLDEGIVEVDKEESINYVNESFAKIVNYDIEKLLTMKLTDLVSEEDYIEIINQSKLRSDGISSKYKLNLITSDNKEKQIILTASPKYDSDNNYSGSTGVFYDLTELEEVGLKFKEVEQINKTVINSSPIGISVRDKNGTLLLHNESWKVIWGLTDAEVRDYYKPRDKFDFNENDSYLDNLNDGVKDIYINGGSFYISEIETKKRKNKNIEWISQYFYAIKNDIGEVEKVVIFTTDITEKKRSERIISDGEKNLFRLASVIEQSNDSVVITDLDGIIEYVNPAFEITSGYSQEEVLGKNPNVLKSGEQNLQTYKDLWNTITSKRIWFGSFVNMNKDGALFYERVTIFPILDDENNIINYAAIKHDITKERKLEEQLQQSQKMESIGTLAGGVAHDFNNLLTVINGHCQLGQLKVKSNDERALEDFSAIFEAGKKATTLVRQLLAFSRKESIKTKVLNLNNLIANLQKMLRRLISEDIEIKINLTPNILEIKADPGQLEQLLINLVVNARDAIIERQKTDKRAVKSILIETGQSLGAESSYFQDEPIDTTTQYVTFSVTDTGCGMDSETKKKIFEPFFTTKESGKGTGLGLAMVYGVVKQNNAEISVYSEINKGTTFSIYWTGVEGQVDIEEEEDENFSELRGCENILLVEDDELIRRFASEALFSLGYNVIEAGDGEEAFNLLKVNEKIRFDLILTDLVMPKMNGKELANLSSELFPDIKVLFVSGYTKDYLIQSEFFMEDSEFMHKPYSVIDLAKKVREVLDM